MLSPKKKPRIVVTKEAMRPKPRKNTSGFFKKTEVILGDRSREKITLGFFEKTQGNDSQHIENFPKITF